MANPGDPIRKFAELLLAVSKGENSAGAKSVLACLKDEERRNAAIDALTNAPRTDMSELRTADELMRILKIICGSEAFIKMVASCLGDEERLKSLREALAGSRATQPWDQYAHVPDILSEKDVRKLLTAVGLKGESYVRLVMHNPAKLASFFENEVTPKQLAGMRLMFALDGEPTREHREIARLLGNTRGTFSLLQPQTRFENFVSRLSREAGWDTVASDQLSPGLVDKLTKIVPRLSSDDMSIRFFAIGLDSSLGDMLTIQEVAELRKLLDAHNAVLEFRSS